MTTQRVKNIHSKEEYREKIVFNKKPNYFSLKEWLELCENDEPDIYPRRCVPFSSWIDEIINGDEETLLRCLRLLLSPSSSQKDINIAKFFVDIQKRIQTESEIDEPWNSFYDNWKKDERIQRVISGYPAWEGLTWIISLLETSPIDALRALSLYYKAQIDCLPDEKIEGIFDCMDIITGHYLTDFQSGEKYLLSLNSRDFERLLGFLYHNMGYEVTLTPATRDGGKDIIAKKDDELIYIECKYYLESELRQEQIRALGYVMNEGKANKACLYTVGRVGENLTKTDRRILVHDAEYLLSQLNSYCGKHWMSYFERGCSLKG